MWNQIGKVLVKLGVWCFKHRDEIEPIVEAAIKAKQAKEKK